MLEVWKDVKEYEGLYQVSNLGRVKSLDRVDSLGRKVKGKILRPNKEKKGYLRVTFHKNGVPEYFKVHRLVATNFIANEHSLPEINHLDEDKENNRVDNLEWCTTKYNCNYGTRTLRMVKSRGQKMRIKRTRNYKRILQYDLEGKLLGIWRTAKDIKRVLDIDNGDIGKCCRGVFKQVGGYRWCYASSKIGVDK